MAGKQAGKEDERYLWPEMLRVIAELKPSFVVGENVPGILRIAASDVVESLEREGYECVLFDFEAAAVGAHHRRERIAFVAHAKGAGIQRHIELCVPKQAEGRREMQPHTSYGAEGRLYKWIPEPDVGRVANGVPGRVDRIKALGKAVVPQQFYPIFRAIAEELMRGNT